MSDKNYVKLHNKYTEGVDNDDRGRKETRKRGRGLYRKI